MRPDPRAWDGYVQAFARVVERVSAQLGGVDRKLLPIRLYVGGGAALHLRTGARLTEDIDAVFSRRVVLDDDIKVAYKGPDGRARLLYLDRNYNDTLGLLHEDAYEDSDRLELPGVDPRRLEVRVLSPLDLAVSKLARFGEQDREDIERLARERLIDARRLRTRAEKALAGYVGNLGSVRTSIDLACNLVKAAQAR
ncbi:MAG: DUF6036 family nucleotidyltransferase [Betaproteobacteria bacterium]